MIQFTKHEDATLKECLYTAQHDSGLKIAIMPKKGYSKSYAIFGTHFGSVDNLFIAPGKTEKTMLPDGIAHFLEHKLFEQPDGSNVFESYAKHGANANAYTSFHVTAYLFESTQDVQENLGILLDFVQKPYFTDENVSKEQGIIGQEIGMYDDDPDWQLMMGFLGGMFHEHPVRIDIAGTVESISKITKETLYDCYNTFYNLSNMCLFIIGDVAPESLGSFIDERLLQKEKAVGEIKRFYGDEPMSVYQKEVRKKLDVSVPMFMLGFKDPDCGYDGRELLKKDLELSVICELLFGKTSPLYTDLYEGGYILGGMDSETACEVLYGYVSLSGESRQPEKVRDMVFEGIKKVQETGLLDADVERVKRAMTGQYIKQFNNLNAVAHQYIAQVFNDVSLFDFPSVMEEITLDSLNKRLRSYFDPERAVLSVIEPQ
ncbi:MAG: insulinase family protein [Ruminococcaceae bacterium]|nr:insulinase family protein [Oscillospiraceae bacterium]